MDTIIKASRIQALVDSLIALQQQAEILKTHQAQGVKRYGGRTPACWIEETAKAMLRDVEALEALEGPNDWTEAKRQYAAGLLSK